MLTAKRPCIDQANRPINTVNQAPIITGPIVANKGCDKPSLELPGGSTPSQYALPIGASELQDLIEHRGMNFAVGNIFKAAFRLGHCDHSDPARDLRKIIYFAERELERITKQPEEEV